jgi:hypothetical protein
LADPPSKSTYRNCTSPRRRSQRCAWHAGEFSLIRILHQYLTADSINERGADGPVVEDSRQDHCNSALGYPLGSACEHDVNRRTVPIHSWTRTYQREPVASDQM